MELLTKRGRIRPHALILREAYHNLIKTGTGSIEPMAGRRLHSWRDPISQLYTAGHLRYTPGVGYVITPEGLKAYAEIAW